MLQPATIQFLTELAANNNKPWFDANRATYEAARKDYEAFTADVIAGLAEIEPAYGELKPKDCVFRIFRDVRFSKDKTPYKPNFGAAFSKAGKKSMAGFYFHLEPGGKTFAGGGCWMPEAPLLKKIRQEIDYNFEEFNRIVTNPAFVAAFGQLEGDKLKTLPAGYTADNQAIEYLKMKSFTAGHQIADNLLPGKDLAGNVVSLFATLKPLIDFMERAMAE